MRTPRILPFALGAVALVAACGKDADPGSVRLNGRIEAPIVDLAPKVAGRVLEVLVREGDRVKSGDVLARLDLGETALAVARDEEGAKSAEARYRDLAAGSRSAEIDAAEADVADRRAAVELAQREVDRQQLLRSRDTGAARDLDRATTDLARAQATLAASQARLKLLEEGSRTMQTEQARRDADRARVQLRQSETIAREAEIRAPADGVVLHRMIEPGQLLGAGQAGLTLAFANRLYVRTFIPETQLGRVRSGQAASVSVDAFPGKTFPAKVGEISPDAEFTPKPVETRSERVNLVYSAKIDLDDGWNAPLVPGQPAEVHVAVAAGGGAK